VSNTIPLSFPDITDGDIRAVTEALRSGRLSLGPRAQDFEQAVARRSRCSHGVAVSSGTAGLHLCLAALGIGPGDEVLTPAFSFVASANCILYTGATPVFVDCDPRTLNMRAAEAEARITDRTKAIIGVELFGNPAGMPQLAQLALKYEIPLIEDACEGLGGRIGTDPIGSFGRAAVFGFYPNQQITTGEGGMIVTDDDHLAETCRSMRSHGRSPERIDATTGLGSPFDHDRLGFNYRMDELSAALGASQIRRLDELVEQRQAIAESYTRRLLGNCDIMVPTVEPETFMSWFVYVVRLSDRFSQDDRDEIIQGLRRHEVGASDYFPVIPLLPFYRSRFGHEPGDFPVAESVSHRTIALPFFPRLTEREIDLVCQTLELMLTRATFARS
jgi:perosamine synthetase